MNSYASALAAYCEQHLKLCEAKLPPEYYYGSLVPCLLDAVFSIGTRYSSTSNAVRKYLSSKNFKHPPQVNSEHTICEFIENVENYSTIDCFATETLNRQRTSSKNGILKAEACYQIAKIMKKHGINTLDDFRKMPADVKKDFEKQYKCVRGQSSGISLKYLYMLSGDDDTCKPDRHLHRFVDKVINKTTTDDELQYILSECQKLLVVKYPHITIRLLDYVIWNYQKDIK